MATNLSQPFIICLPTPPVKVAFRFVEAANAVERAKSTGEDNVSITVCDINTEMLRVGERRARERFGHAILDDSRALSFVQGNAQDLHFDDNQFDLYTIAFGLRNVTDVDRALSDASWYCVWLF